MSLLLLGNLDTIGESLFGSSEREGASSSAPSPSSSSLSPSVLSSEVPGGTAAEGAGGTTRGRRDGHCLFLFPSLELLGVSRGRDRGGRGRGTRRFRAEGGSSERGRRALGEEERKN